MNILAQAAKQGKQGRSVYSDAELDKLYGGYLGQDVNKLYKDRRVTASGLRHFDFVTKDDVQGMRQQGFHSQGSKFFPERQKYGDIDNRVYDQNKHAYLYKNSPEYRKLWKSEHGGGIGKSLQKAGKGIAEGIVDFAPVGAAVIGAGMGANYLMGNSLLGGAASASNLATPAMAAPTTYGTGVTSAGATASNLATPAMAAPTTYYSSAAKLTPPSSLAAGGSMGKNVLNALNIGSALGSAYLNKEATEGAIDEQRRQYNLSREDLAPYREAAYGALNQLSNFDPETDPIMQYQLEQALDAINARNAATGNRFSGAGMNELTKTAIGETGRYQGDAYNRLLALAGLGSAPTQAGVAAGQNAANAIGGYQYAQGQGYNNALQGALNNYLLTQYLDPWS